MTVKTVINHVARTHPGKVREHNEDCYYADAESGLFIVADGMGGMEAGEVASAIARDETVRAVKEGKSLADAIKSAHQAIRDAVEKGIGAPGMGTTIVTLRVVNGDCELAWVGDSRAYLWDADKGSLRRVTRDHSHVELLLASGVITPDQAHKHPQKNLITQCLGQMISDELQVGVVNEKLLPGQSLLLCSDGLNDELTDTEIAQCLANHARVSAQAESLLQTTLEKGARDNVTLILVHAERKGAVQKLLASKGFRYALLGIMLGASMWTALRAFVAE